MIREPAPRTIVVDAESAGKRLDVFLAECLEGRSRSMVRRWIESQHVLVEGRSVKISHKVRAGQHITIREPEPIPAEPQGENIPLSILFEDADLVVLDKPPGLVVHPAAGITSGTLVNALLHHCQDLSGIGGVLRPGIVHRLDRDTSGVMVVTKNDRTHQDLARQFSSRTIQKAYIAFVVTRPFTASLPKSGCFDTYFGRHPRERKRFSSRVASGRKAVTFYRVLARFEGQDWSTAKLELSPKTGRTHQLRVHLADAGHPILGDKTYGGRSARNLPKELIPIRQALHALRLSFDHPASKQRMTFEAPLPQDMVSLEQALTEAQIR